MKSDELLYVDVVVYADKKENQIFPRIQGNSEWSS